DVRAGQVQRRAEEVDEQRARLDVAGPFDAVDGNRHVHAYPSLSLRVLEGGGQAPAGEDPHDVALVLGRAAPGGPRCGGAGGELRSLREQGVARRLTHERLFGLDRLDVVGRHRGERDAGVGDRAAAVDVEVRGDADGGVVADLALQLEVRAAAAAGVLRDAHLGDELDGLERSGERPGD